MSSRTSRFGLIGAAFSLLLGCQDENPLAGGDAEWPAAPIPIPGGNGTDDSDDPWAEDDSDPGSGTGADTTTTGSSDEGWDEPIYSCEESEDNSCDTQPGVCEPASEISGETEGETDTEETPPSGFESPCCQDSDCQCDGDLCYLTACDWDGYCDCRCVTDPDCTDDTCPAAGAPEPPPSPRETRSSCPDTRDPVVLYMSNDDSNSQASPALVRALVSAGSLVPKSVIRVHEFLNYYDLNYKNRRDEAVEVGMQMRRTNEATGQFTLLLSAQGREIEADERPPLNLVFSLDTSGSMAGEPFSHLKDTIRATASQLREGDIISLVEWNDQQRVVLDGHRVDGPDDAVLRATITALETGGSTDLHSGLVRAYALANENFMPDGINRVFLVSDGGANTGITDIELISSEASDADGSQIYMVGVGVGTSDYYSDELMDDVTDAGKGAYLYVDSREEADRMFGDPKRFLANIAVAARNVQMELKMPWYFGIKEFHGEEYSEDPAEVEPQHLAPNDAMSFHQTIESCDPQAPQSTDKITATVTYTDVEDGEERSESLELKIGDIVQASATQLHKADVIVSYAKAFIVIADRLDHGDSTDARLIAEEMAAWLEDAAATLDDDEVRDMANVMTRYAGRL